MMHMYVVEIDDLHIEKIKGRLAILNETTHKNPIEIDWGKIIQKYSKVY
jgi:hypothetical protein